MRFVLAITACLCLPACDGAASDTAGETQVPPGMASEITVELPPPAAPAKVKLAGRGGKAGSFKLRPPEGAATVAAWPAVLRKNGFPCDRIASARQLEQEGGRPLGIYRIECASGGTYQGTRRDGRLYFRRWSGQISRG